MADGSLSLLGSNDNPRPSRYLISYSGFTLRFIQLPSEFYSVNYLNARAQRPGQFRM